MVLPIDFPVFAEIFRGTCRALTFALAVFAGFAALCRPASVEAAPAVHAVPASSGQTPDLATDGALSPTAPSAVAARVLAWIAAARDNGSLPYIVIDKRAAALFLFDRYGAPMGEAPVLIGVGVGDDSSPGVGAKTLAEIGPAERTTPAGRFVARYGLAFGHTRVLWVDYPDSVAIHAVITTHKEEHRIERLLSPTPDDNRITFGCINVSAAFYDRRIRPLFSRNGGVVYVLPDSKSVDEVFPRLRLFPYLPSKTPGSDGGTSRRDGDVEP
jgi:hypothetical protein